MAFTVACAQIAPRKAQVEANLDHIAEAAVQASKEGADLVLFPETATSGYFLEGGVLECSLSSNELHEALTSRLQGLNKPLDLVLGFYERGEGQLFNSAVYLTFDQGKSNLVGVYRKFFLPTYGVFDEERFVARGRDLGIFETRFGKVAILICEDVWHTMLPTLAALRGAQIMLVPAASPARGFEGEQIGNLDRYERMLRGIAEEHGVFCVNTQLCGFEGGKGFVGGSMVIDPMGRTVAKSPIAEEHLLIARVDLDLIPIARTQSPLFSDLRSAWGDLSRLASEDC